jgi:hypothetical protein
MIGIKPQRRGLFGSGMMPQYGASMPQGMGIQENPMAAMAPEQPKQRWMDGGKFGTKDAIGLALGAIGDAFTGRPMTSQMILGARQDRRQQEQALAAEQRALQNQRELIGYSAETEARYKQPKGPEIGLFEDNAGNRFRYDKTTGMPIDEKPIFVDPNERVFVQDGAVVRVPNTFRQQSGMPRVSNRQEYDALPPGAQYTDPNGNIRTKGGSGGNVGGGFRP